MKNRSPTGGLVYSTDAGRMCPTCRQPVAACSCSRAAAAPAGDGIVRVSRETAGRKGKGVTVIREVPLDAAGIEQLGRELKALCGTGGTVKDGVIEIQGDQRDRVIPHLQQRSWTVKRAGG